jgi:hypothetical protein
LPDHPGSQKLMPKLLLAGAIISLSTRGRQPMSTSFQLDFFNLAVNFCAFQSPRDAHRTNSNAPQVHRILSRESTISWCKQPNQQSAPLSNSFPGAKPVLPTDSSETLPEHLQIPSRTRFTTSGLHLSPNPDRATSRHPRGAPACAPQTTTWGLRTEENPGVRRGGM